MMIGMWYWFLITHKARIKQVAQQQGGRFIFGGLWILFLVWVNFPMNCQMSKPCRCAGRAKSCVISKKRFRSLQKWWLICTKSYFYILIFPFKNVTTTASAKTTSLTVRMTYRCKTSHCKRNDASFWLLKVSLESSYKSFRRDKCIT